MGYLYPGYGSGWEGGGTEKVRFRSKDYFELSSDRNYRLEEIELSPFQESILSRGLRAMHDVEDKMCNTVDIAIGYSAVLGAKLFAEVETTNNILQRLDQNQVSYSRKVCFR